MCIVYKGLVEIDDEGFVGLLLSNFVELVFLHFRENCSTRYPTFKGNIKEAVGMFEPKLIDEDCAVEQKTRKFRKQVIK